MAFILDSLVFQRVKKGIYSNKDPKIMKDKLAHSITDPPLYQQLLTWVQWAVW